MFDIQTCIVNIDSYIGEPKMYDKFELNQMLQDAVERNLEIIGEAEGMSNLGEGSLFTL